MIRLATLFWLILVAATGAAMFIVKYQVQDLEEKIARTAKANAAEQHEIRSLTAEWAYLNRPESLDAMNRRYLSLIPVETKQLRTSLEAIPLRPAGPPVADETLVAGAAPAESQAAVQPLAPASQRKPDVVLAPATPKPGVIKALARPGPAHPARSIDDLLARIATNR